MEVCSAGKQAQHSRGPGQLVQVDRLTDSTTLRMVQTGSSDIFARHVTRSLYEHGEKPSRTDSSRPDKVSWVIRDLMLTSVLTQTVSHCTACRLHS